MTLLTRQGVVARGAEGELGVVFEGERCAGCNGHCGLRLGRTRPLPLCKANIGTPVEVVASALGFVRQAAVVFGLPVAAGAGLALVADWRGWHELWSVAAIAAGLVLPFAVRLLRPPQELRVTPQGTGLRVELR